jgi:hypothetical protein
MAINQIRGLLKPIPLHKDGVAIMARSASPGTSPPTHAERGQLGILERLATEDWAGMTAAALAAPRNPKGMDRWRELARQNEHLNDEQVERLAVMLRREHFRKMGRLSAQARRLAREAQAELERVGGAA